MTYGRFAYLYDELMADVPYDNWLSLTETFGELYKVPGKRLLDIACGTGELTIRFALQGFNVTGVDLSEDMLAVAKSKSVEEGIEIPFYQQNMAELEGLEKYDFITIFCDSINYLTTEEEVIQTFEKVSEHLSDHGLFLFDVHSVHKMENIFKNQTFTLIEDDVCYIWNSFQGENAYSIEHELTFFVKDEKNEKYDRIEEYHFQRTYPIRQYESWLNEKGFEVLQILGDLENKPPTDESERILFIARKANS
jgi:cyclopropane fatty-acyl-phospholipid synthase-like methyltransferase